ncbi:MAG: hypothetical protein COS76_01210 [Candidatus Portnoybacteria bacterium CG06_land_8_20_14_3_00_39_12]|uniref:Magnesium transporter CorA n=2 Tax=Candidatus Portnoyibacteriota TaxID=1817913 RepID=A0A2M8KFF2_9BACT|nr:MAG: hypothetical protein COS76_01210 [Candidatus Portnoybacteria bacterium CG06_land_8_20_14_3_00_39_12]PJE58666.1 MAG: hypothetical protein COU83_02635 [Candidatus Portnoybacteria bacterium CG10_big_fil_rev_8_21_14_0_10_40_22]
MLDQLTTTQHMRTIKTKKVSWIDIDKPDSEDIVFLKKYFDFDPIILKEYLKRNKQTKIEKHKNYLFLILYFPIFDRQAKKAHPAEIDFFITKDRIVTGHYDEIMPFEDLIQRLALSNSLKKQYLLSSSHLLLNLINLLFDACQPMLDHIQSNIEKIDNQSFNDNEAKLLNEIAIVKRDINNLRLIIRPQHHILKIITSRLTRFFKSFPKILAQETMSSYLRVWHRLEIHKQTIEAIENTNTNLLSFKMNRKVNIATVVSALLLPLFFITSFFNCINPTNFTLRLMTILLLATGIIISVVFIILHKQKKL